MRVVVVDDNDVWRPSLVTALSSRGITVLADTADGQELLAALPTLSDQRIDVAVLDLRLPPTWSDEGIHLARELRRRLGDHPGESSQRAWLSPPIRPCHP